MRSFHALLIVLGFGAALSPLSAPLLADTVVLENGDRITGKIEELSGGKLMVSTAYAGKIPIDWSKIVQLSADNYVTIEMDTGRRYTGLIQRAGNNVIVGSEDTAMDLPSTGIVGMVVNNGEREPGFWDILDGSVDLGYSFTRGNSRQTQSSVGAAGDYRKELYELQGSLSSIFSEQDDSDPTSRHVINGRMDRFLGPRAFTFLLTGFERNDRQQLNLRSRFGGGFGWKLAKTQNSEFSVLGGFTYTNEQFRESETQVDPRTSSGEGVFGFEWKSLQFQRVRVNSKMSIHPNITQTGRYRVEFDTSLRVPLLGPLTYTVSLFDRFDSDPPLQDLLRNDYGLVSALGFTF